MLSGDEVENFKGEINAQLSFHNASSELCEIINEIMNDFLYDETIAVTIDQGAEAVDAMIKAKINHFENRQECCGSKVEAFDDGYICKSCQRVFE